MLKGNNSESIGLEVEIAIFGCMKFPNRAFSLFVLFCCGWIHSEAQINHYQSNQVGARSTMLGGAVVGYVRDNSAVYYNPSGLAYIKNSSLSVIGDAVSIEYLYEHHGAGPDVGLRSFSAEATPQIFSGILKSKKNPILTINYAIINVYASRTPTFAKSSGTYDVFSDLPGEENYSGVFEYYNSTREDWFGAGWGYKLYDRLGFGFSLFLSVRSQTHRESVDVNVVVEPNKNISNLIGSNTYYNSVYYLNLALIGKFGMSYEFERIKLGANLTLPRAPLTGLTSSTLTRSDFLYIPHDTISSKRSFSQQGMTNVYKSPLSIDLGLKYLINSKNSLYLSTAFYGGIDKYNIINSEAPETEADKILAPTDEKYNEVNEANRRIVNVSIGVEHLLSEELSLLFGFNTDLNYLDYSQVDRKPDFVPSNNTFNIYHVSGGVDWTREKFNLNLGLRSSFGHSYNTEQFVNLTNPSEDNYLWGTTEDVVQSDYFKLTLVVGFTYFFPRF